MTTSFQDQSLLIKPFGINQVLYHPALSNFVVSSPYVIAKPGRRSVIAPITQPVTTTLPIHTAAASVEDAVTINKRVAISK